ncbi:MAG: winged helix-turn-helix domain-containing protein [Pseudomonadota bacterium]
MKRTTESPSARAAFDTQSPFRIGLVLFDLRAGFFQQNEEKERLEPRLGGVLALLVTHYPEPVTRDMFLDLVWDGDGSDEALTQAISRMRKILKDSSLIHTLPRIGYRLTEQPMQTEVTSSIGSSLTGNLRQRATPSIGVAGLFLICLVIAMTSLLIMRYWHPQSGEQEFIPKDQEFIVKDSVD